jgi:hypothetical protein
MFANHCPERRIGKKELQNFLHTVGRVAAEHLLAAIDGAPRPGLHLTAPRVIVRESTAANPIDGGLTGRGT